MEALLAARLQMALSLGFHIIFASIGMAMPFMMCASYWRYLKAGEEEYLRLTKLWSKGVAVLFATGAVSGTVLAFELGLLWPGFMEHAGPIIGMPFSWEGTAFFLEAIALGLFLYGWNRLPPKIHWTCGLVVGFSGLASALFVMCANAWMNHPTGFDFDPVTKTFSNIDPYAAMFSPGWFTHALHMLIASFEATGFAVAGLHAFLYLRHPKVTIHLTAMRIALIFACVAAILQPLSGDLSGKKTARTQPAKLAAMENLKETTTRAPLLGVPGLLSFLAFNDIDAEVKGLNHFPEDERPPAMVVHVSFMVMVGIGTLLMIFAVLYLFYFRKRELTPRFLKGVALLTPLGFIALEAGWIVTEVGRQPWIIYEIMKTHEAVTPVPGLTASLVFSIILYLTLTVFVVFLMSRLIQHLHRSSQ